jgi:hypothetical protein
MDLYVCSVFLGPKPLPSNTLVRGVDRGRLKNKGSDEKTKQEKLSK